MSTTLVIGIGHPDRGDDAAGLEVARRVRSRPTHQSTTGTFEIIDLWGPDDEVVIVDATRPGRKPGSVVRFDAVATPLPDQTFSSTHVVGLAETIALASALDRLPRRLEVIGIEAGDLTMGAPLSPAVAAAVARMAEEIDGA